MVEVIMRKSFLLLAKSKSANKMAKKFGLRFGAGRFVGGNTIDQAIEKIKEINEKGMVATLNYLGEYVHNEAEAKESTLHCLKTLDAIAKAGVQCNLSVKITSLGLDIDKATCIENVKTVLERAKQHGNFIRIDMEDYAHCDLILDVYHEVLKEYSNVGTAIQAYLYRAEEDIQKLNEVNANLRLIKGAFLESHKIVFPKKSDVDNNFMKIIELHLCNGNYAGVATHDDAMVDFTKKVVEENDIPKDQLEFQMLYGIRLDLQEQLVKEGYRVRVYVPYGIDWYGYFMRRLAERPANVWFVMKNMFK